MQDKIITPEQNIKKLWLIQWTAAFVVIIVLFLLFSVGIKLTTIAFFGAALAICAAMFVFAWIPVHYDSIKYTIKDDCVEMRGGVFFKRITSVPYQKITNIDVTQDPLEKFFNFGTIHVQTAGMGASSMAEVLLCGIRNPEELKNLLVEKIKSSPKT